MKPISNTAFYCCGVRMQDAEKEKSVCQDILIGAGFDSRAYRLTGGRWIELDEPQIISYKNERLPIERCKNKLQRISIDFETESLAATLQQFATHQPVLVIVEGVFIYLPENVIKQTLQTLHGLFPEHKLVCELMTEKFYKKYSYTLHQNFGELGAGFKFTSQQPATVFFDAILHAVKFSIF